MARPFTLALVPTIGTARGAAASRAERAAPLIQYLERALGRPVHLAVAADYEASLAALRSGRLDAAVLGQVAALRALEGGGVEALVTPVGQTGQVATYESALVTRINSGIHDPAALRGRTLALVEAHSASGYLAPRALLREAGLDPDADVDARLLGTHRAVAEAVIAGEVDAGGLHAGTLRPPGLERGPDYARLRVLARSQPIPRGPIAVRANLPLAQWRALADALLRVHQADPAAAAVLNLRGGQRFSLAARPSSRLPTLKSVAALAGVSYATVSRVVNMSGYVAPETAARVAAIVKELGYRPNGNALTLHGQRAPLVGLVVDRPDDPEVAALFERLRAQLAARGVPLVLCPAGRSVAASPYAELLMDGRLGALIVTAAHAADPALAETARTGRTIVALETVAPAPGMITAAADEVAAVLARAICFPERASAGRGSDPAPSDAGE